MLVARGVPQGLGGYLCIDGALNRDGLGEFQLSASSASPMPRVSCWCPRAPTGRRAGEPTPRRATWALRRDPGGPQEPGILCTLRMFLDLTVQPSRALPIALVGSDLVDYRHGDRRVPEQTHELRRGRAALGGQSHGRATQIVHSKIRKPEGVPPLAASLAQHRVAERRPGIGDRREHNRLLSLERSCVQMGEHGPEHRVRHADRASTRLRFRLGDAPGERVLVNPHAAQRLLEVESRIVV